MHKKIALLHIFLLLLISCSALNPEEKTDKCDLTVFRVQILETSVQVKKTITVIVRIANIGTDYAPASLLRLYLSFNDTLEESDIGLDAGSGSKPVYDIQISSLSAGTFVDAKKTVKVPENTRPGLYKVIAHIDPNNKIVELNDNNNTCVSDDVIAVNSSDPLAPNLALRSFNVSPTTVAQGSEINVTWNVMNIGNSRAGEFYVGVFITSDTSSRITINDRFLIAGRAVAGGLASGTSANQGSNYRVQVPFNLPAGKYKCGVIVDYMNAVAEANELNNYPDEINNPLIEITVEVPGVDDKPDIELVTAAIIDPINGVVHSAPNSTITVQYQLRNNEPFPSPGFPVHFYLSSNANLDLITDRLLAIDDRYWNGLKASESPTTVNFQIMPSGLALEGTYYLFIVCDPDNQVSEVTKSNNISQPLELIISNVPTPGADDIVVSNLSDAITALGSKATTSFDIDFPVPLTKVEVAVFLSLDATPGANDIELHRIEVSEAKIGQDIEFWVPPCFNAQIYTLFVLADPDNKISESSENNNTAVAQLTLTNQLDSPDLVLSEITIESSNVIKNLVIVPSDHLVVSVKITNEGDACSTRVRLGLYIASNANISEASELIAVLTIPALAPGEVFDTNLSGKDFTIMFTPISKLWTIPSQVHYIGAIVDDLGQLVELYETNNMLVSEPFEVLR